MIRFRNPGTQYTTQVQVFKELYKEYKDAPSFDLDDMASTITKTKLMTAYGYAGDAALALSNTENDSLNSTKMNAKMYAEVFRLLGWITSAGSGSYPLVFTYIGEHAALADDDVSRFDGRSMIPNILVRNLIIALNHKCAISRTGDVYTRMDALYSSNLPPICKGVVEVEFGRDTLEASRGVLDDIAVMHSRNNLNKNENAALVVCLSFPNKRQGYFQVIKDINRVLGLKIQTISLGALLLLVWNGAQVNFLSREFYVDFDNLSIRNITEFRLNRHVNLSEGKLGILEPEK